MISSVSFTRALNIEASWMSVGCTEMKHVAAWMVLMACFTCSCRVGGPFCTPTPVVRDIDTECRACQCQGLLAMAGSALTQHRHLGGSWILKWQVCLLDSLPDVMCDSLVSAL